MRHDFIEYSLLDGTLLQMNSHLFLFDPDYKPGDTVMYISDGRKFIVNYTEAYKICDIKGRVAASSVDDPDFPWIPKIPMNDGLFFKGGTGLISTVKVKSMLIYDPYTKVIPITDNKNFIELIDVKRILATMPMKIAAASTYGVFGVEPGFAFPITGDWSTADVIGPGADHNVTRKVMDEIGEYKGLKVYYNPKQEIGVVTNLKGGKRCYTVGVATMEEAAPLLDKVYNIAGIDAEKLVIHDINERYTKAQIKKMTDVAILHEVDGSYMEATWQKGALLIHMLEKLGLDPMKMLG